ncbi:MAG: cupin domain-containing protein [Gammaproteobacteria bacterium]
MTFKNRRVVTGLDDNGKSCVISDAALEQIAACGGDPAIVWQSDDYPPSNAGNAEAATPLTLDTFKKSSFCVLFTQQPGTPPAWHQTDTLDYVVVLTGRVRLALEAGEVELAAGDVVVDRGVMHSWSAIGDEPAVMLGVVIRAQPLGDGSHFDAAFDQYLEK